MAKVITAYDPYFYANEAITALEKSLGMAGRIHRGYDEERRSFNKGSTIKIRKPSTFTAQDAPSVAQDIDASELELTLSYWKEVKFVLSDKDLTLSDDRIISDHIQPAAYALADDLDYRLSALAFQCPWYYDLAGTTAITDLTGPYQVMFDNKVPMDPAMLHYMVNGSLQAGFQNLAAFNTANGAGQEGMNTQMRGTLGQKFGFEVFANQNVQSKVVGTIGGGDKAGAVAVECAKGATSIQLKSLTADETIKLGDTFVIAGNTQRYAITANATVANPAATVTLAFVPPMAATAAVDAVVTLESDAHVANLAFHRNFAALATAPMTTMVDQFGIKVASVTDEKSQLTMRSRVFADPNNSNVYVALDWLYGFKMLDANLGCRCRG